MLISTPLFLEWFLYPPPPFPRATSSSHSCQSSGGQSKLSFSPLSPLTLLQLIWLQCKRLWFNIVQLSRLSSPSTQPPPPNPGETPILQCHRHYSFTPIQAFPAFIKGRGCCLSLTLSRAQTPRTAPEITRFFPSRQLCTFVSPQQCISPRFCSVRSGVQCWPRTQMIMSSCMWIWTTK
jgi:hypothetical protein